VNSPIFLTLALIGTSCVYLFVVAWSFRASGKRDFSTPWLLLPLSGAIIVGVTLVFSVPVSPASPVLLRLLELLAHLCNILLIWAIVGKIAPASRLAGTWLYAWNPLALIELAVYANTAGVVICLLLLAVAMLLVGVPSLSFTSRLFKIVPAFRMGVSEKGTGGGRRKRPHPTPPNPRPYGIAALVLVGLGVRINFMTLLIAPLLLWFMVRHRRGVSAALMGFTWRALVVLAVLIVAYLPGWQGSATFLAITNALDLFDFANSPLSLIVMPVRGFFSFVAQRGHFPPSLMQPTTAADMMVLATSFFLFALLYLREMGQVRARIHSRPAEFYQSNAEITRNTRPRSVGTRGRVGWMRGPCACPRRGAISLGSDDPRGDISQRDEDNGTEQDTMTESQFDEDKHKAPALPLIHPLSLQDEEGDSVDTLLTSWAIVVLGYIVLAATVFSPGYIVWGVWVVALRRFDTLSVCVLLLSCSALLYYPLQQFASTLTGILLPVCVFGIPLVYLIVQCCIPAGRIERKNVLT
jgi:hypothetical protein